MGIVLAAAVVGYAGWRIFAGRSDGSGGAGENTGDVTLVKATAGREPEAAPVLTATGKIVSDHRVQVATKVSGQVVALYFEQGDRIEQGQLLARIEKDLYQARRDEAAALLEKSKATAEFQKVDFARVMRLFEQQQASDIEYAEAKKKLDEAVAQVAASEALLAAAGKALRDCDVQAPIGGVVLERNVEVGDFVAAEGGLGAMANSQFALIADMQKLRVEVDVSELDIARLRTDMLCVIIPDAYKNRRYDGHLMWIDPGANYAKATVQVKVRIDNPDEYLRVEGAAQVQFLSGGRKEGSSPAGESAATTAPATAEQATGVWIPTTACRIEPDGQTGKVYVARDGRLKETVVKLGRREGSSIEVIEGLSAGEELAADAQKAKGER